MKKILLLGGSAQQVTAIETAKRLGYFTVLCDYLTDNPGQYVADRFYQISTTDKETVLQIAETEKIDGVLAYASDPAATTAAYVAEKLKLPGNPYKSVEILCNKDRFRDFLKKNGFEVPASCGYGSLEEAVENLSLGRLKFPIIIKPVDSSGSKGVTVLYSDKDLYKALEFAFSFSRKHRVIVEEFVEKKHPYLVGGDIFVVDGEICIWGLLNCHRDNNGNPLVPVGKSYPLKLNGKDEKNLKETLNRLVQKLEFKNGAMNVELIIDKDDHVFLIDIGPRCGGNMIPDLLSDIFGVDIVKLSVQAAMGKVMKPFIQISKGCFATYNLHSIRNGFYQGITFADKLKKHIYRRYYYKNQGDIVEYFDNASKCLGIIFMRFENKGQMEYILNEIDECIQVHILKYENSNYE